MKAKTLFLCIFLLLQSVHAQLAWDTTQIEMKPAISESSVTAVYTFRNVGKEPISIKAVKTSCDCTTATFDKSAYGPGETGKISVRFDFGHRSGKQEKTMLVETTDLQTPNTMLALKVWIPELLTFDPKVVNWALNAKPEPQVVRLKATGEPVTITSVKSGTANFTSKLKMVSEGREFELTLTPKDLSKPGYTAIQVFTDKPIKKTMTIVAAVR